MKVGKHYVKGLLSSDAPESIIPVRDLVNPGGCMMLTGSSCVLIDKDGDTTHTIPGKHGFFYMPINKYSMCRTLRYMRRGSNVRGNCRSMRGVCTWHM